MCLSSSAKSIRTTFVVSDPFLADAAASAFVAAFVAAAAAASRHAAIARFLSHRLSVQAHVDVASFVVTGAKSVVRRGR